MTIEYKYDVKQVPNTEFEGFKEYSITGDMTVTIKGNTDQEEFRMFLDYLIWLKKHREGISIKGQAIKEGESIRG